MRIRSRGAVRTLALALAAIALGGCADHEPTAPTTEPAPPAAATPIGVMEIAISGIGTPYASPRRNLTFLAAATDRTLGETPISRLGRFDGAALDAHTATGILPTGAALETESGKVASRHPDVLQVLTEADLAALQAEAPVASVSFAPGSWATDWPLWPGSVTRILDYTAHDTSGAPLPDVPVHLGFSDPDALRYWQHKTVRMVPRRDRATVDVTAAACGQTTSTEMRVSGLIPVGTGSGHSLAVREDGTVAAWGYGGHRQVEVPAGLANVVQVGGGGEHSLALKRDGTVVAWGWNEFGQAAVPASLVAAVP